MKVTVSPDDSAFGLEYLQEVLIRHDAGFRQAQSAVAEAHKPHLVAALRADNEVRLGMPDAQQIDFVTQQNVARITATSAVSERNVARITRSRARRGDRDCNRNTDSREIIPAWV